MTRVATVLDPCGSGGINGGHVQGESEADEVAGLLRDFGVNVLRVGHWTRIRDIPAEADIELLVVDYGALWQDYNYMDDESRDLLRFAEDHPGTLIALWSSMTADGVVNVLNPFDDSVGWWEDNPWPDNVVPVQGWLSHKKPRGSYIGQHKQAIDRILAWCS